MKEITTIGLDLAKQIFQVHAADFEGAPVTSRKLRRADVLSFSGRRRGVWSGSRRAVAHTIGRARSRPSGMRCG